MKRLSLLGAVVIGFSFLSSAQTAFQTGTTVLQPGIGFGLINTYGNIKTPPISLTLDVTANNDWSLGGYVGYASSRDVLFPKGSLGLTEDTGNEYTYFIFGGRANYHFAGNSKVDPYMGAMLGYNAVSASSFGLGTLNFTIGASAVLYGGQVGIRYFASPNFGFFAEAGYGVSYITGGISLKF